MQPTKEEVWLKATLAFIEGSNGNQVETSMKHADKITQGYIERFIGTTPETTSCP